jgi:hypothetical protein
MGLADAVTTQLFASRRRSDLEMQISFILERKLAVQDRCNAISSQLAQTIFQNDNNGTLSAPNATNGYIPTAGVNAGVAYTSSGFVPNLPAMTVNQYGANNYEQQLGSLQQVEKQLDTQQKKMETELEAIKAEEDSFKKIGQDHAKNDFKIGG